MGRMLLIAEALSDGLSGGQGVPSPVARARKGETSAGFVMRCLRCPRARGRVANKPVAET